MEHCSQKHNSNSWTQSKIIRIFQFRKHVKELTNVCKKINKDPCHEFVSSKQTSASTDTLPTKKKECSSKPKLQTLRTKINDCKKRSKSACRLSTRIRPETETKSTGNYIKKTQHQGSFRKIHVLSTITKEDLNTSTLATELNPTLSEKCGGFYRELTLATRQCPAMLDMLVTQSYKPLHPKFKETIAVTKGMIVKALFATSNWVWIETLCKKQGFVPLYCLLPNSCSTATDEVYIEPSQISCQTNEKKSDDDRKSAPVPWCSSLSLPSTNYNSQNNLSLLNVSTAANGYDEQGLLCEYSTNNHQTKTTNTNYYNHGRFNQQQSATLSNSSHHRPRLSINNRCYNTLSKLPSNSNETKGLFVSAIGPCSYNDESDYCRRFFNKNGSYLTTPRNTIKDESMLSRQISNISLDPYDTSLNMTPSILNRKSLSISTFEQFAKRNLTVTNQINTNNNQESYSLNCRLRVIDNYQPTFHGDVSVLDGEVVTLIEKSPRNQNLTDWLFVRRGDGKTGYVPKQIILLDKPYYK
ncbi:unnamed protein product [Didymodactylos carnosus]|uniref:SH3 domain-containing protein n=1 Tax=Didymodactylos carnosus TaxID=1234261 RepID=A0A813WTK3_9BILA|nr:unnamed protein product [Didymodactylos carnosus]CAF0865894.1 unnamed protein product [Didymodactylos carnosus]CAF3647861.1 unnamed protein product [Didymodactylos carnosus]CAF3650725.1 unnamed protein product [Didymodactylos carnosus]